MGPNGKPFSLMKLIITEEFNPSFQEKNGKKETTETDYCPFMSLVKLLETSQWALWWEDFSKSHITPVKIWTLEHALSNKQGVCHCPPSLKILNSERLSFSRLFIWTGIEQWMQVKCNVKLCIKIRIRIKKRFIIITT